MLTYSMYAQQDASSSYIGLGIINDKPDPGEDVCPSLDSDGDGVLEVSSLTTFRVKAYDVSSSFELGAANDNIFEWVVYGAWITKVNGVDINIGAYPYSRMWTSANIRYSYVSLLGVANPTDLETDWYSNIEVEWDTTNFSTVNAWVAVQHRNEWNCSNEHWSVFENNIQNNRPQFNALNFPQDNIHLPYKLWDDYVLPLPDTDDDDGCNNLVLTLSYVVHLPDATTISGVATVDDLTRTVDLQVGDNLVEWTVFDGSRSSKMSYTIIVDPQPEILNIAWINPTCNGVSDGKLFVTDTTDYPFPFNFEFSFNGGAFTSVDSIVDLEAGVEHTVDAQIQYRVDFDNIGGPDLILQPAAETYKITLTDNQLKSVATPLPDADITFASCHNSADGKIEVPAGLISENNNSVSFDGDDYLLLNKKYQNGDTYSNLSIATWIKIPSVGNTSGTLISFDGARFFELLLDYYSTGNTTRVHFRTNTEEGVFFSTTKVNDDKWHLVVATYDGGIRRIYIDNDMQESLSGSSLSIGGGANNRYGIIGAGSTSSSFTDNPRVPFFVGDMAEMAIWESNTLDAVDVENIRKDGIKNLAKKPTDHWVLNGSPASINATPAAVFTDLGNKQSSQNWARFVNGSLSTGSSPKLYTWSDIYGNIYPADTTIENLVLGFYTLTVKDLFGCGGVPRTYEIENNDEQAPEFLWNAALGKNANQSSTIGANFDSNAIDGFGASDPINSSSQTNSEDMAWWEVDLEGIFPVRGVYIHPTVDFSDFYVLATSTYFTGTTVLHDRDQSGVTSVEYSGPTNGPTFIEINANARYVRIRAIKTTSLYLSEVEVLTDKTPVANRELVLTSSMANTECIYRISDDEFSIAPYAYDACDGITSFYNTTNFTNNLENVEMALGDSTVTWLAIDDRPSTTSKGFTYTVIDNTDPVFDPMPFASNPSQIITYCQSESYSLLIPKVDDNYPLSCGDLTSLELYRTGTPDPIYTYLDDHASMKVYDPAIDEYTGNINMAFIEPGDRELIWQVVDHSANSYTDTLALHIEKKPRVLEVKVSPITCFGANNGTVTFSRIESEHDVDTDVHVVYNLRDTTTHVIAYTQTDDSVFYNVQNAVYEAFITVNTCSSDNYYDYIVLVEPDQITLETDITPVQCSGWSDGAIDLTVSGGSQTIALIASGESQTNILHFLGGDNKGASVDNYAEIDLGATGTIEGWIYIDTLGRNTGEPNYNTGLFGTNNGASLGYGFTIVDSVLTFWAGANFYKAASVLTERTWMHIAGTWNEADESLIVIVNGTALNPPGTVPDEFTAPTGGSVYLGMLPGGIDAENGLHGFVQNVRIWNTALTEDEIKSNRYLLDPIDYHSSLVANFPLDAGGNNILKNKVPGATQGEVYTATFDWQKFAFYWTNSSGDFVARTEDLANSVADYYTVVIDDPRGCSIPAGSATFRIENNDSDDPIMNFSNFGYNAMPHLTVGEAIYRYTNNSAARDCNYSPLADATVPSKSEFDPYIDDGVCPASDVEVTYTVLTDNSFVVDPSSTSSLNGSTMTDITRIKWTATDRATNSTTKEVPYYIIDTIIPTMVWEDQIRSNTSGACAYTVVKSDSLLAMTFDDNCETGNLYNNINGLDSLTGQSFSVGTHIIRWTYDDKTFPGGFYTAQSVVMEKTLTVVDDQLPEANCYSGLTVTLDDDGLGSLTTAEVDNLSRDNCGNLSSLILLKNLAFGASASQSSPDAEECSPGDTGTADKATDGNISSAFADCSSTLTESTAYPQLTVTLDDDYSLFGVNVYNSDKVGAELSNFWVLVSIDGNFDIDGSSDWTNPVFLGAITYSEYFAGTVSGYEFFNFGQEIPGHYVQIRMNATAQLSVAEVEVFGTSDISTASEVGFDCTDIRYTPKADPLEQGTFSPIRILLTAIDEALNSKSCISEVTVEDQTEPIVNTQLVYLDVDSDPASSGAVILDPADVNDGSTDNCTLPGDLLLIVSPEDFNCTFLTEGLQTVTLTVVDEYANQATAEANVIVEDHTDPVAVCYEAADNIILDLNDRGEYVVQVSDLDKGSYDNCAIAYIDIDEDYQVLDCSPLGALSIPITIYDNSGNHSTCTAEVTVEDNVPPFIVSPTYTLTIGGTSTGRLLASDLAGDTYDNCAESIITYQIRLVDTDPWGDYIDFSCAGLLNGEEEYTVWLQATDSEENSSVEPTNVIVRTELQITSVGIAKCGIVYPIFANVTGNTGTVDDSWDSGSTAMLMTCGHQHDFKCIQQPNRWNDPETSYSGSRGVYINDTYLVTGNEYTITYTASDDYCSVYTDYTFTWDPADADLGTITYDTVCPNRTETYSVNENAMASVPGRMDDITYVWDYSTVDNGTHDSGGTATDNEIVIIWDNQGDDWGTGGANDYFNTVASFRIGNGGSGVNCNVNFDFYVNIRPPLNLEFDPYITSVCPLSIQPISLVSQATPVDPPNDEWIRYVWSTTGTPENPQQYEGGNLTEDWVDVLWGTDTDAYGTIKVVVTDKRTCSDSIVTDNINVDDETDPVIVNCPANEVRYNSPLQCDYLFVATELPGLTIADITDPPCLDAATSPYYTFEADRSDFPILYSNRTYPVGTTTVTWTVTDLAGHTDQCFQSITVVDNEAPIFTSNFNNVTMNTLPGACDRRYLTTDPNRDATVTENCPASVISYLIEVDFGTDLTVDETVASNSPVDITGAFPVGKSTVSITVSDNAVDENGDPSPNSRTRSFTVTLVDAEAPAILPLDAIPASNDYNDCEADLSAIIAEPTAAFLTDNCTSPDVLATKVQFVRRDDGRGMIEPYPVGTTVITWRVTDASGNSATGDQNVVVTDTREPWFNPADNAFQPVSIGYCDRATHRLEIPTPSDNCLVNSITWRVYNSDYSYDETGTITRALSATFNPNGDDLTNIIPELTLDADPDNGDDFIIVWTLEDIHGITNTLETYSTTLHVEVEPAIGNIVPTQMTCGNANDGKVTVTTTTISGYRVEVDGLGDPVYNVYYSIDNWDTEQMDDPIFKELSGGTYNVQIRVNGCYSNILTTTIEQPEVYVITLDPTHPYCYEGLDGEIDLTMTGGVAGQMVFSNPGDGVSADYYAALDLTNTGSIEAWVYLESLDDATLITKGTHYALRLYNGKFTIDVNGAYLGDAVGEGAGLTAQLRHWYYVAGTWDSDLNEMDLHINNDDMGTAASIRGTLAAAPVLPESGVTIGQNFAGIIREVRIWSSKVNGITPDFRYGGSEPGLMAYWPMENGSGPTSPNSCTSGNADAEELSDASSLWDSEQPQPGYYSWTLGGSGFVGDDEIDLLGIGRGIYEVTFQDQYICPADPGLQKHLTLKATDAELPDIENIGNQSRYVDDDLCTYTVKSDGTDDELMPGITDAGSCEFTTTWKVVPEKTLLPQLFYGNSTTDSKIEGAVLELGVNRVEVTTSQYNGNITSSTIYNITVIDDNPPHAIGQDVQNISLSNDYTPMGSGVLYYDALNFNNESWDNCTDDQNLLFQISDDGVEWKDALTFICEQVGFPVNISFKVIDEAGIEDIFTGGVTLTVTDIYDPVFIGTARTYEACVTDDEHGEPFTVIAAGTLPLDETDYTDNCSISLIEYSIDQDYDDGDMDWTPGNDPTNDGVTFYEGNAVVSFRISDNAKPTPNTAIAAIYYVTILPKPAPSGGIH